MTRTLECLLVVAETYESIHAKPVSALTVTRLFGRFSASILALAFFSCAPSHQYELEHAHPAPAALAAIPASRFCREVDDSVSPDGRFAVAVGYSEPRAVDWGKLREYGSYHFDRDSPLLINALIDRKLDRALSILPSAYFGTKESYNHDRLTTAWSPSSNYLIVVESAKWWSSAWLWTLNRDGHPVAQLDLMPIAKKELREILMRQDPKSGALFDPHYQTMLSQPRVDDGGRVSFHCGAAVPISIKYPTVELGIQFQAKAGALGKLKVTDLVDTDDEEE